MLCPKLSRRLLYCISPNQVRNRTRYQTSRFYCLSPLRSENGINLFVELSTIVIEPNLTYFVKLHDYNIAKFYFYIKQVSPNRYNYNLDSHNQQ